MKRYISLIILCAGLTSVTKAHTSEWVMIAESKDHNTIEYAKPATFRHANHESRVLIQESVYDKISYQIATISDSACDDGYGKIKFLDMDGRVLTTSDYVSEGMSIASSNVPSRETIRNGFFIGSALLPSITQSDAQSRSGKARQDYRGHRRFFGG